MEKKITDEQLIELLEGKENTELQNQIDQNPALQKRYFELKEVLDTIEGTTEVEVPVHIKMHVQQAIMEEQSSMQRGFGWMHIAAVVAILIVGFSIGRLSENAPDNSQQLTELKDESTQ